MDPKKSAMVIIARPKKEEPKPDDTAEAPDDLHQACEEIMGAIREDDVDGLCDAFTAAFRVLESMPHEEANEEPPEGGE